MRQTLPELTLVEDDLWVLEDLLVDALSEGITNAAKRERLRILLDRVRRKLGLPTSGPVGRHLFEMAGQGAGVEELAEYAWRRA
jgi:hypothetical protein